MATRILDCPECKSRNIETLNPEKKDEVNKPLVKLDAKCGDCGHEFQYSSATTYGKRKGILY